MVVVVVVVVGSLRGFGVVEMSLRCFVLRWMRRLGKRDEFSRKVIVHSRWVRTYHRFSAKNGFVLWKGSCRQG